MRVSITQGCSFLPATIEEEGRKEKKKLSSKVICHSWAKFTFKKSVHGNTLVSQPHEYMGNGVFHSSSTGVAGSHPIAAAVPRLLCAEAGLSFWREGELVVSSGIASVICLLSSHIFE